MIHLPDLHPRLRDAGLQLRRRLSPTATVEIIVPAPHAVILRQFAGGGARPFATLDAPTLARLRLEVTRTLGAACQGPVEAWPPDLTARFAALMLDRARVEILARFAAGGARLGFPALTPADAAAKRRRGLSPLIGTATGATRAALALAPVRTL